MTVRYLRTEPMDVLIRDEESLVLLPPDLVVRLSPIATVIHQALAHPMNTAALAAVVERRFGSPPGEQSTEEAVALMVAELCGAGILKVALHD